MLALGQEVSAYALRGERPLARGPGNPRALWLRLSAESALWRGRGLVVVCAGAMARSGAVRVRFCYGGVCAGVAEV